MGKGRTVARPAHPGPTAPEKALGGAEQGAQRAGVGREVIAGRMALKHHQCVTSVTQVRGTGHGGALCEMPLPVRSPDRQSHRQGQQQGCWGPASTWGDGMFWNQKVMVVAQHHECAKGHGTVHFETV